MTPPISVFVFPATNLLVIRKMVCTRCIGGANVDNIFNEHYIARSYNAISTGAPTQFKLSVGYDF